VLPYAGRVGSKTRSEAGDGEAHDAIRDSIHPPSDALDAGIGIFTPLIYREIINNGFLKGNAALIIRYAVLACVLGLFGGALGVVQSYLSAMVGGRVVLGLRTKLFEHIQQMPLAFFTRVQRGALVSRLNTDVGGAQGAFTDILSNVVGNSVTLVGLLVAMFALSWRMTVAALILVPLFVFPVRFWGRKLQGIVREAMTLNASMSSLMTERFNVAGAYVTKIFGRPQDDSNEFAEKAGRVSAIGVKTAIYGRLFGTAIMIVTVIATSFAYGWGGVLTVQHRLDLGTVVAFLSYLSRLYMTLTGLSNVQVTVMTALVSFERVF
jgi:ATP-binding cassette subfamily B protein